MVEARRRRRWRRRRRHAPRWHRRDWRVVEATRSSRGERPDGWQVQAQVAQEVFLDAVVAVLAVEDTVRRYDVGSEANIAPLVATAACLPTACQV